MTVQEIFNTVEVREIEIEILSIIEPINKQLCLILSGRAELQT